MRQPRKWSPFSQRRRPRRSYSPAHCSRDAEEKKGRRRGTLGERWTVLSRSIYVLRIYLPKSRSIYHVPCLLPRNISRRYLSQSVVRHPSACHPSSMHAVYTTPHPICPPQIDSPVNARQPKKTHAEIRVLGRCRPFQMPPIIIIIIIFFSTPPNPKPQTNFNIYR
jgi:hypothetical protein